MPKPKFKVGDKVKLKNPTIFKLGYKVCTIIAFTNDFIDVIYDGIGWPGYFPLKSCEIEKVNEVGKQLVFPFMETCD